MKGFALLILEGLDGNSSNQELKDTFVRSGMRGEGVDISGQSFQDVGNLTATGTSNDSQFSFVLQRGRRKELGELHNL